MGQLNQEDVLDIANQISAKFNLDITENWNDCWPRLATDTLVNCWYLSFNLIPQKETSIATAVLLAISKENGGILYSGLLRGSGQCKGSFS